MILIVAYYWKSRSSKARSSESLGRYFSYLFFFILQNILLHEYLATMRVHHSYEAIQPSGGDGLPYAQMWLSRQNTVVDNV